MAIKSAFLLDLLIDLDLEEDRRLRLFPVEDFLFPLLLERRWDLRFFPLDFDRLLERDLDLDLDFLLFRFLDLERDFFLRPAPIKAPYISSSSSSTSARYFLRLCTLLFERDLERLLDLDRLLLECFLLDLECFLRDLLFDLDLDLFLKDLLFLDLERDRDRDFFLLLLDRLRDLERDLDFLGFLYATYRPFLVRLYNFFPPPDFLYNWTLRPVRAETPFPALTIFLEDLERERDLLDLDLRDFERLRECFLLLFDLDFFLLDLDLDLCLRLLVWAPTLSMGISSIWT